MRNLLFILCFFVLLGNVGCREHVQPGKSSVDQGSSLEHPNQIRKADEVSKLKFQALDLVGKREYETAKNILEDVLEFENDLSLLMLRCMLGERTGEDEDHVQKCYRSVAEGYGEMDTDDPLNEINRISALLFARAPHAAQEAESLIKSLKGTELEELSLMLFKNFDREAYLLTILP
ncbi:hypothetical protein [Geoalkalibacter halelectricus]|uniref:Tetratricopeptide repeat protein n=1 Tax=Geoalkalibacter halelectricus TaxID=2847045 RepID=A0ABY5ZL92_9BACT|nr:hypothetical protein [Geoalkalibacter halelectricus]MDO3378193.1 hypothetical protein [Geoalkalibacter halelectricus]UWZ78036.1 hypothetical protein L9S41_10025 [Geoalkalibacter halelectricus]